jgi:uncharacterized protein DUF6602
MTADTCETGTGFKAFYDALSESLEKKLSALRILDSHSEDKGDAVETFVRQLLTEHVPCGYDMAPGHVVMAETPNELGTKLDLVIYDPSFAKPLLRLENGTCIFPFETVVGVVEVTASLDKKKLLGDLKRVVTACSASKKVFFESSGMNKHVPLVVERPFIHPRSFIFAAESRIKRPETVAKYLQTSLQELGETANLHLAYIGGLGVFRAWGKGHGYSVDFAQEASVITFAKEVAIALHRMPVRPLPSSVANQMALKNPDRKPSVPFLKYPVYPHLDTYLGPTGFSKILPAIGGSQSSSTSSSAVSGP